MLLPDKHIRIAESILGVAGLVLATIKEPMSLDELMASLSPVFDTPKWPAAHGVESVVMALCFLNSIGVIDVTSTGDLVRCG